MFFLFLVFVFPTHFTLITASIEQCRPNMVCPLTSQEVCGFDGLNYTTFKNDCFLRRARCQSGGKLRLAYIGPCETGLLCRKICPITFQPVCGNDGKTYANSCILDSNNCLYKKAVTKAYDGSCQVDETCWIQCSEQPKPICASNGQTYPNDCAFKEYQCKIDKRLKIAYYGNCRACSVKVCKQIYQPVCGTDGQTYVNECILFSAACKTQNIELLYYGSCDVCSKKCGNIMQPICGSNNQSYNNECYLEQDNCKRKYDNQIQKISDGKCDECLRNCGNMLMPVCGSDGKTYDNDCHLTNVNCGKLSNQVRKMYDGRCIGLFCDRLLKKEVCGTDGQTYINDCFLSIRNRETKGEVKKDYSGKCLSKSERCTIKIPSLASCDLMSYTYNYETGKCEMYQGCGYIDSPNSFKTRKNCEQICKPTCAVNCPNVHSAVCGTDLKVYSNTCLLSVASCFSYGKISFYHSGVCGGQQTK